MEENRAAPIHRELGAHEARIEQLEKAVESMSKDVREIRDTVTGVKGSWKMLVAIASLFSGALVILLTNVWSMLFPGGRPPGK
jgi:hypothetical protein